MTAPATDDTYIDGRLGVRCGQWHFPRRGRLGRDTEGFDSAAGVTNQEHATERGQEILALQAWQVATVEDGREQAAIGAFLADGPRQSGRNIAYWADACNDKGGGASGIVVDCRGAPINGVEVRYKASSAGWALCVKAADFPGAFDEGVVFGVDRRGVIYSAQMADLVKRLEALEGRPPTPPRRWYQLWR